MLLPKIQPLHLRFEPAWATETYPQKTTISVFFHLHITLDKGRITIKRTTQFYYCLKNPLKGTSKTHTYITNTFSFEPSLTVKASIQPQELKKPRQEEGMFKDTLSQAGLPTVNLISQPKIEAKEHWSCTSVVENLKYQSNHQHYKQKCQRIYMFVRKYPCNRD